MTTDKPFIVEVIFDMRSEGGSDFEQQIDSRHDRQYNAENRFRELTQSPPKNVRMISLYKDEGRFVDNIDTWTP